MMVRIALLILVILGCFLIFWITSRSPQKKLKVDFFRFTNLVFYFVFLAGAYICVADEIIGFFVSVASIGVITLRKYFYGRWI